jgi:GT2 family glycosyltransferase
MSSTCGAPKKVVSRGGCDSPSVRAVIVNYNSAELTLQCIRSLRIQNYPALELVVVDNHSNEEQWSTLRKDRRNSETFHRTRRNLGYAGGINAGAKLHTGQIPDYILVLNSDITLADPNSVLKLVTALRQDSRRVACSPLVGDKHRTKRPEACVQVRRMPSYWTLLVAHSCWLRRTWLGRRIQNRYLYADQCPFPLGATIDCETINGACFMISKTFLEEIGYMDEETFLYMEEFTLGAHIRRHTSTACLCTAVVVDHIQGASTGMRAHHRPFRREMQQIQSEAIYLKRYAGAGILKMGVFRMVRAVDLFLKGILGPFWSKA